jgi:hypothetical protein
VSHAAPPFTVPPSEVRGDVGDVTVVDENGKPLQHGDGSSRFFVRLPAGATCPGDSANDQWRVNTFLIPIDKDPLQIVFGSSGPEPPWTGMYPLFNVTGNLPIVFNMLRNNGAPGQPGIIDAIEEANFRLVAEDRNKGGRYRMGVACSYFAQTTQYWDTEIDLSPAPDGKMSQLMWALPSVVAAPTPVAKAGQSAAPWIGATVGLAAAMLALAIWRARRVSVHRLRRSDS